MKRDKLEQYIANHRHEFEQPDPGEEAWKGIQDRIRPVRRIHWQRVAWQSAAAVAIFFLSWVIHDAVNRHVQQAHVGMSAGLEAELDHRMQELLEADAFYTYRIAETREAIYKLSGGDDRLMEDLDTDLEELEKAFEELKDDLRDDTGNQEVIEAMIQNYRIKLEILEEMLIQLKRSNDPNENTRSYEL